MDRFTRQYLVGLGILLAMGIAGWAVSLDFRAAGLNDLLREDPLVADYPYPFRVQSVKNGIAAMYTPRSASMPAVRFLAMLRPDLAGHSPDDPVMVVAQQQLARVQARAKELVIAEPDIDDVRWVPDISWYERRGVTP